MQQKLIWGDASQVILFPFTEKANIGKNRMGRPLPVAEVDRVSSGTLPSLVQGHQQSEDVLFRRLAEVAILGFISVENARSNLISEMFTPHKINLTERIMQSVLVHAEIQVNVGCRFLVNFYVLLGEGFKVLYVLQVNQIRRN